VADHGRESSREPLTQREREVIHELAREIVKEAGLGRNPDQEAAEKQSKQRERMIAGGRGYWNAQVDIFKHMATVSAATVVGVPVVLGAFVPDPKPLGSSMPLLLCSSSLSSAPSPACWMPATVSRSSLW
jgi:hypothetical protein